MATQEHLRILVVDDEEAIRMAFSRLLANMGHACTTAADGKQCLDLLEKNPYDLLIIDLVMPNIDGETVLNSIRGKLPNMDIVVISAQDDEDVIGQILRLGSSAYLVKPIESTDLKDVIQKILLKRA